MEYLILDISKLITVLSTKENTMKAKHLVLGMLIFGMVVVGLNVIGHTLGWFGEATQVVREEFGPRAMLEKYEWFKDASAQLDRKKADIKVYKRRLTSIKEDYKGTARKDWDRTDKEQFNLWQQEVAGTIASFNGLAAEYNAQMAKFNWKFTNKGDLPKGATEPLPREFKTYAID